MAEHKIDHIDYGGTTYPFVDATARANVQTLAERVTNLNAAQTEALEEEVERAEAAESALEDSKVTKVTGKGLSTNDFTDEYKALLDSPAAFTGATAMTDGVQGDVPAPVIGEEGMFLCGDGTWGTPQDTTYDDATQSVHGLMSTTDKIKLDGMDGTIDAELACSTVISTGQITQTFGSGKTKTIVFNQDGSITETITKPDSDTIVLNTTFGDGTITRTRTVVPV